MESDTLQNYQEAIQCPEKEKWVKAINKKFDSHQLNKTWELTELTQGQKVHPGWWVYKKYTVQQVLLSVTRHVGL